MSFFDDVFWPEWPDKQNKKIARKRCVAALNRGVNPDEIMAGLRRYLKGKPDWKGWMHATTFFNGDRWEDEYAEENPMEHMSFDERREWSRKRIAEMNVDKLRIVE